MSKDIRVIVNTTLPVLREVQKGKVKYRFNNGQIEALQKSALGATEEKWFVSVTFPTPPEDLLDLIRNPVESGPLQVTVTMPVATAKRVSETLALVRVCCPNSRTDVQDVCDALKDALKGLDT